MVRMFAEGSVFLDQPQGKLVDVTPSQLMDGGKYKFHPVYRSGISLTLPIKIKEKSGVRSQELGVRS